MTKASTAQRKTGSPVTIHHPFTNQGERILEILEDAGADLNKVIFGHMDNYLEEDMGYAGYLCDSGAYIGFDAFCLECYLEDLGLSKPSDSQRIKAVVRMIDDGYLDHIFLSLCVQ